MHSGFAPAKHIVVHAGHVIVNQGISVNQFNRTSRAQCSQGTGLIRHSSGFQIDTDSFCSSQNQKRPEAFAAVQDRVTHRFTQTSRGVGINALFQNLFNLRQARFGPSFEIEVV